MELVSRRDWAGTVGGQTYRPLTTTQLTSGYVMATNKYTAIILLCTFLYACGSNRSSQAPSVDDITARTFDRVDGDAEGGAHLDVGPASSWYSKTVGAPTVVYDGYIYGATSTDGIHWTPAWNDAPLVTALAGSFNSSGPNRNTAVHPDILVEPNGRVRVWYMGENSVEPTTQRIGLLEAINR